MKKKILSTYKFHPEPFKILESNFDITYPTEKAFKKEDIVKMIGDYDVLIPNFGFYTDKEMMDNAPKLKLIANFGVGFNNVDIEYAASKGIVVANTPNSVLEPTAELCFGLMLAVARRIAYFSAKLRTVDGLKWGLYDNAGLPLYGKTLGIIGCGRIGQAVARRALASGMKIIYNNRHRLPQDIEDRYQATLVDLDTLMAESDFISVNAPSTPHTFHVINERSINLMKPSAIVINTSRGSAVDDEALIKALTENRIFGAGLDVFENEPYIDPRFFELDNVVLTPHTGTQTIEGRHQMQAEVAANIINFFDGGAVSKVN